MGQSDVEEDMKLTFYEVDVWNMHSLKLMVAMVLWRASFWCIQLLAQGKHESVVQGNLLIPDEASK